MGVFKRQQFVDDNPDDYYFWHTTTGEAVRWGVFAGILGLLLLWMIVGSWHAKHRLNKGLPPLAYHKWLLSRRQRAIHDPSYRDPQPYYNPYHPQAYNNPNNIHMHPYVPPPPVYDPNSQPPPVYQPPPGATKVDPSQWRSEPTRRPQEEGESAGERVPDYEAPPGPPPARLREERTGESNNPFRG